MNYRTATILAQETQDADITKVIDLNIVDPISQIQVIYCPLNAAEALPDGHPAECVTKIELVDGSDVLYSLSGKEAQALDFYHNKWQPHNLLFYINGVASRMTYNMNFGRFLWDPLLALDPGKFSNLQLKISIDINAGGCTVAEGHLAVLGHIFDEKRIVPTGFLMSKEIKDYTLAASGHEYTDLPTDYPIRKLCIRGQVEGTDLYSVFSNIKVSEDNDKRVPFDLPFDQIMEAMVAQTPLYRESYLTHGATAGRYYFHTPCHLGRMTASRGDNAAAGGDAWAWDTGGGRSNVFSSIAGRNVNVYVDGWCPHGVISIPFGDQKDLADWYDVTKVGTVRLDVTAGSGMSSSQSMQVFLQQLRT